MGRSASRSKPSQLIGATMKDVAAYAGVSTATVSRVLSAQGGVRKELELRVREAIQALNYRPNQSARRLRARKSRIIGVLVPDIQIPFFATIVVEIDKVLQKAGYLLLLGNTNDTLAGEQAHIDIFLSEEVSGVIFAPADFNDTSNYAGLIKAGVPMVAIDRVPGDLKVDTVQVENQHAASLAVRHFIEEGHSRIGFIAGPRRISTSTERQAGYEQTLKEAGIALHPDLVQQGGYVIEGGYQAMRRLMDLPEPPSAVLTSNNLMTLGALRYIHEKAYNIPEDISIIGYDDLAWASALKPPLSVIAQPESEIGLMAARLMLDRLSNPDSFTKHVTLEAQLILRSSCRCSREPNRIKPL